MTPIKNKITIKTFQRPSGENEFKAYLDHLDTKAKRKFITVLNHIETKGQLVARKNQWISNVRDTGLIEFRSNLGRNQQRGLGYYDHQHNLYVLLTGFTKKDERFNKPTIEYAKQLKQLALEHPHFVDYTKPMPLKPTHKPKPRQVKYVKSQRPTPIRPVKPKAKPTKITKPQPKPVAKPISKVTKPIQKQPTLANPLIDQIQKQLPHLTPHQLLIVNALIASWSKPQSKG